MHFNRAGFPLILSDIQYRLCEDITKPYCMFIALEACLCEAQTILGGNQRECATAVGAEQLLKYFLNICVHQCLNVKESIVNHSSCQSESRFLKWHIFTIKAQYFVCRPVFMTVSQLV